MPTNTKRSTAKCALANAPLPLQIGVAVSTLGEEWLTKSQLADFFNLIILYGATI